MTGAVAVTAGSGPASRESADSKEKATFTTSCTNDKQYFLFNNQTWYMKLSPDIHTVRLCSLIHRVHGYFQRWTILFSLFANG
jgi:hypothetical protein